MNKKGFVPFWIEIIGGAVASVLIIFIVLFIASSTGSTISDAENIQEFSRFVNSMTGALAQSSIGAGEQVISPWRIAAKPGYDYAIAYIPYTPVGSDDLRNYITSTDLTSIQKSWISKLDFQSINEMNKCSDGACMCLFKIEYTTEKDLVILDVPCGDFAADYNIITVGDNPTPAEIASAGSIYKYEFIQAQNWLKEKLVKGVSREAVESAEVLRCINLKDAGCIYVTPQQEALPCMPHYRDGDVNKPVVWMHAEEEIPLKMEQVSFQVFEYPGQKGSYPVFKFTPSPAFFLSTPINIKSDKVPCDTESCDSC